MKTFSHSFNTLHLATNVSLCMICNALTNESDLNMLVLSEGRLFEDGSTHYVIYFAFRP